MELLIIWLCSILVSIGMDIAIVFKLFKDVAGCGYKIDYKRIMELKEQLNTDETKIYTIGLFIPAANIMLRFNQMLKYNQSRPFIIDKLRIMDCIEPFSKGEEQEYKTKPTGLKAMMVSIESEAKKDKNVKIVSFKDDDSHYLSFISYRENDNGNRIITRVEGPVAKLSIFEQKVKLDEVCIAMDKVIKESLIEEKLISLPDNCLSEKVDYTLDINNMSVRKEVAQPIIEAKTTSPAEQRELLEQLRESVISQTQEVESMEEKGQPKVLKHKK